MDLPLANGFGLLLQFACGILIRAKILSLWNMVKAKEDVDIVLRRFLSSTSSYKSKELELPFVISRTS